MSMTPEQRQRWGKIQTRLPWRLRVEAASPAVIRDDTDRMLYFLDRWLYVAEAELAKMRETDDKRARAATVLNGLRRDLDNAVSTLAELDEAVADGRLAPIPTLFVDPAAGPDFVEPARHPLCDGDKSGPCGLPAGHFERVGSAHVPAPWREHVGPGGVGPLPGE